MGSERPKIPIFPTDRASGRLGPDWKKAQQCSSKLSETTSQVCPFTFFWQKQAGRGAWLGNHTTIVFWSKSLRSLLFHISSTSCHCLLQSGHPGATPIIISQNKKAKLMLEANSLTKSDFLEHNTMKVVSSQKIPSDMEVAPRYKLLTLLTML